MNFKENDRVIWNSGFGYEIGYFKGDRTHYHTWLIEPVTGIVQQDCSYPKHQIEPYSKERIIELTKQYGYEKSFSEIF